MNENQSFGSDERAKKSVTPQSRAGRDYSDASRTQKDGTAMTREERAQRMRSEWEQEVLPTPPANAEWHYCWLSTTNGTDPIYKRVQKGYEPVKVSEMPGFTQYKVTQGEFEGCIACNEMVLFKLPMELYQDYMSYLHYERPMNDEASIRNNVQQSNRDSNGRSLGEVEGFDSLAKSVRLPTF